MKPGLESYYEKTIARGADDYYAEAGESPGTWTGAGATAAGISGQASAEQLGRLFGHGHHPLTNEPLGQRFSKRAVSGHSISLSAPKGVSILWALGDPTVAAQVRAAHDAAVEATVGYLDRHVAFSRVGAGGPLQVDTDGLIVAAYVHRTSRALDPQLHTHLLVANKVRCPDGRWRALDARELFHSQKAGGAVYRAALRAELTARLGVTWTPMDDKGLFDVVGVPERLVDEFSTRSREVDEAAQDREDHLEQEKGRSLTRRERAGVRQAAALSTRAVKDTKGLTTGELTERWHARAKAIGCAPSRWIRHVLGRPPAPVLVSAPVDAEAVVRAVEAARSTFSRQDLTVEVARRLTTDGMTATEAVARLEAEVDRVLTYRDLVSLEPPHLTEPPAGMVRADGLALERRHGANRYSTLPTLTAEAAVLDLARTTGAPVVDEFGIRVACGAAGLGADQVAAVHRVCETDGQLVCLVGPAGTGKSRSVQAIAAAYAGAGVPVTGLALSANAAHVLSDEARMVTETIAKHLHTGDPLPAGGVLIVDEAGLVPTHILAALAKQAAASGSKLVLVGDPHQLGAVGAGGLFPLLAADTHALDTVRRFTHSWEADASLQLRTGNPACIDAYLHHDRISSSDDGLGDALEQWVAARTAGADVLVVAVDHATVDEFNAAAQAERITAGEVTEPRDGFGVGDDVITLRNDRHAHTRTGDWVANGDRWTITATNGHGTTLASRDDKGTVTLPPTYVAEHLALGYATTLHKAQGRTVDRCIALLPATATREQAYVALTRGRDDNHAHVVPPLTVDDHQAPAEPIHPREAFAAIVANAATELTATETLRRSYAATDNLAVLVPLRAEAQCQIDAASGGPWVEINWRNASDHQAESQRRLETTRHQLRTLEGHLPGAEHRLTEARRELRAAEQRRFLRRPDPERLAKATSDVARCDAAVRDLEAEIRHFHACEQSQAGAAAVAGEQATAAGRAYMDQWTWQADHPQELAHLADLDRRISDRAHDLGTAAWASPPAHVVRLIGDPATSGNPAGWQHAAAAIEAYREQWGTPESALGRELDRRGYQARQWDRVEITITDLTPAAQRLAGIDIGP